MRSMEKMNRQTFKNPSPLSNSPQKLAQILNNNSRGAATQNQKPIKSPINPILISEEESIIINTSPPRSSPSTVKKKKRMGSEVFPVEIVNVADDDDFDDDVTLIYPPASVSRNRGTNTNNAISVEQYSEDRDLHLAIIASLFPEPPSKRIIDDDDVQVLESFSLPTVNRNKKPIRFRGISITEPGQSSNSNTESADDTFMCEICVEPKPYRESFSIMGCTHSYCSDCMIKYVASKLQENITQMRCPVLDCKGLLEPEDCRSILPAEVFDRWGNALCEAVILASEKFYCPYKDCSTLLLDDRGELITQSECPDCQRLFCVQCKVPWHSGIECAEFQKLNNDERATEDIMLMQLAKNKKWMRCPKCRFYVERSQGCLFMRCRCGHSFCYNCGATLGTSHFCSACKR